MATQTIPTPPAHQSNNDTKEKLFFSGYFYDSANGTYIPGWLGAVNTPAWQVKPDIPTTWAINTVYHAGDIVIYGDRTYKCLQGHTSQLGWEPPNDPALWLWQVQ